MSVNASPIRRGAPRRLAPLVAAAVVLVVFTAALPAAGHPAGDGIRGRIVVTLASIDYAFLNPLFYFAPEVPSGVVTGGVRVTVCHRAHTVECETTPYIDLGNVALPSDGVDVGQQVYSHWTCRRGSASEMSTRVQLRWDVEVPTLTRQLYNSIGPTVLHPALDGSMFYDWNMRLNAGPLGTNAGDANARLFVDWQPFFGAKC